jgi:hypothetical protein
MAYIVVMEAGKQKHYFKRYSITAQHHILFAKYWRTRNLQHV